MTPYQLSRYLRQVLLVSLFGLVVLAGCLLWQVAGTQQAQRRLDRSDRITAMLVDLQKLIDDQETGLRGYQLTGEAPMLAPYKSAAPLIEPLFAELKKAVADNADQTRRLAVLHDRYMVWLGFAQSVLTDKTVDAATAQRDPLLNAHGKALMDAVRAAAYEMQSREAGLRYLVYSAARNEERLTFAAICIGVPLAGLLLGLFMRTRLQAVSRAYRRSADELEQRAAEVHAHREWLQTTLESIGDAVIACDRDGKVEFLNLVAQKLTGWTPPEAKGKPLATVFHIINEETRKVCENPVEKVQRLGHVVGLANHTVLVSKDGKEYVIDDSAAPIRSTGGEMIGVVLVFRDVTELRRTEAALVANEKLATAGRLAASIAHEIHNPLDSIANLHFLMQDESEPVKRAEYLALAQQELARVMQISRTMLGLYREPSSPVQLDLKEMLESVLLLLERRLAEEGVSIARELPEQQVIEGFPGELRQVFTNIILNAAEAAGRGGRIMVRLAAVSAEELHGAGMLVEVRDSGPGVENGAAANLFQPFFTTKGANGTGLGLWVSQGIVQKHGGSIRISTSSIPEYPGAVVRVFMPAITLATSSASHRAHWMNHP